MSFGAVKSCMFCFAVLVNEHKTQKKDSKERKAVWANKKTYHFCQKMLRKKEKNKTVNFFFYKITCCFLCHCVFCLVCSNSVYICMIKLVLKVIKNFLFGFGDSTIKRDNRHQDNC